MKIGHRHPVEIFEIDLKVHAVPAQKGWEFRSTICGKENPVLGWDDRRTTKALCPGRCKTAIRLALAEEKEMRRRAEQQQAG